MEMSKLVTVILAVYTSQVEQLLESINDLNLEVLKVDAQDSVLLRLVERDKRDFVGQERMTKRVV